MKDTIVKTEIVEYITKLPKRGRRGSSRVDAGITLYLIKYLPPYWGYFTFGYMKKEDAETSVRNSKLYKADTEEYWGFNRKKNPEDVMHIVSID